MFFEGNGRFTLTSTRHTPGVRPTFLVGRGTSTLRFADSDNSGVAVGAGPLAAGTATRVRDVPSGIAGAVALPPMLFTGLPQTGSYTGPGGRHGSWTAVGVVPPFTVFAGPPGRWSWTWAGAATGAGQPPAVAAYAPVGRFWSAFEAPPTS